MSVHAGKGDKGAQPNEGSSGGLLGGVNPAANATQTSMSKRRRMSNLFGSSHKDQDNVPPGPIHPEIVMYAGPKPKEKKKVILTMKNVTQAFAVYPERPELISRSTLIKVEGFFGDEEIAAGMKLKEGWLLLMPDLDTSGAATGAAGQNLQASEMLKWTVGESPRVFTKAFRYLSLWVDPLRHPRCIRIVWATGGLHLGSSGSCILDVWIPHWPS